MEAAGWKSPRQHPHLPDFPAKKTRVGRVPHTSSFGSVAIPRIHEDARYRLPPELNSASVESWSFAPRNAHLRPRSSVLLRRCRRRLLTPPLRRLRAEVAQQSIAVRLAVPSKTRACRVCYGITRDFRTYDTILPLARSPRRGKLAKSSRLQLRRSILSTRSVSLMKTYSSCSLRSRKR